jgi:hypothetical protein
LSRYLQGVSKIVFLIGLATPLFFVVLHLPEIPEANPISDKSNGSFPLVQDWRFFWQQVKGGVAGTLKKRFLFFPLKLRNQNAGVARYLPPLEKTFPVKKEQEGSGVS